MPMTPREIVKLLEANGFEYVSSNGSHRKYRNPATGKTTIVPFFILLFSTRKKSVIPLPYRILKDALPRATI